MRRLSLFTTLLAVIAATVLVGVAVAAGPTDLTNNQENGSTAALASGLTYRASLFPVAINFRSTDRLWQGAQYVRTAGVHEGQSRKGAKFAFVTLLHTYAHNAQGKITNWGRGTITFEAGLAPTGSLKATMARLRVRLEDFQTVGKVSTVHVAGFSGLSYDGHLKDGARSFHRFVPFSSADGSVPTTDSLKLVTTYGKGEAFRVIVVDVRGVTVFILVEGETAPADKFPVFLGFADRLLSTTAFPR